MKIITKFENIEGIAKEIGKIKNVNAVYLFGSYAMGRTTPLSDIDLCIIGKLTEREKERIMGYSSDNLDLCFFDELPIWIQIRVFSEGKSLVVNHKEILDILKIITLKRYLDFKPLINKYVHEVLNVQSD